MSRLRREKESEADSLFAQLPGAPSAEDEASAESFALFVGQRASGKSSLLALLQGGAAATSKAEQQPKPTVALEYFFARRSAKNGLARDVAHIWELGGGTHLEELVSVPVTPHRLPRVVLGVVVDLSKPADALASLDSWSVAHWVTTLRRHVAGALDGLRKTPDGAKTAERLVDGARAKFATLKAPQGGTKGDKATEHPDRRAVDPCAVPLLIVCNKFDAFRNEEPLKKKALVQALRFVAHFNGATLVFASTKDRALESAFRQMLSYALFHKTDKSAKVEVSADKAVFVPAGADTFADIAKAGPLKLDAAPPRKKAAAGGGGLPEDSFKALQRDLAEFFGTSTAESKSSEDGGEEGATLDEAQFAEPVVDELYAQKMEALARYRKKMEQKEKEVDMDKKRRAAKAADAAKKNPTTTNNTNNPVEAKAAAA